MTYRVPIDQVRPLVGEVGVAVVPLAFVAILVAKSRLPTLRPYFVRQLIGSWLGAAPDERVTVLAHPHGVTSALALFVLSGYYLAIQAAIVLANAHPAVPAVPLDGVSTVSWSLIGLAAAPAFVAPALDRYGTIYAVTDRQLLRRDGLVGGDTTAVRFTDVTAVAVDQGHLQRLLGVGDVTVETVEGEPDRHSFFRHHPDPGRVAVLVRVALEEEDEEDEDQGRDRGRRGATTPAHARRVSPR